MKDLFGEKQAKAPLPKLPPASKARLHGAKTTCFFISAQLPVRYYTANYVTIIILSVFRHRGWLCLATVTYSRFLDRISSIGFGLIVHSIQSVGIQIQSDK